MQNNSSGIEKAIGRYAPKFLNDVFECTIGFYYRENIALANKYQYCMTFDCNVFVSDNFVFLFE